MSNTYKRRYVQYRDLVAIVVIVLSVFMLSQSVPGVTVVQFALIVVFLAYLAYYLISPFIEVIKLLRYLYKKYKMKMLIRATSDIDELNWSEFEHYVADKLKTQGYTSVRLTEHYDLGLDIIARKGGVTWGVQVKHYKNTVRIEAVREAVAALKIYKCDRAMVVTNNFFTNPARELAKSNDCVLIDRKLIAKWR